MAASNISIQPAAVTPSLPVAEYDKMPGGPSQPLPAHMVVAIESTPTGWVGVAERGEPNQILLDEPQEIWFNSLPLPASLSLSETLEDAGVEPSPVMPAGVESAPETPVTPVDNPDGQVVDRAYELPPLIPEPGYNAVALHIEAGLLRLLDGLSLPSSHQPRTGALRGQINSSLDWYELVPVLNDLTVLVLPLADNGQHGLEEYLQQLSERLENFLDHPGDAHASYTDVLNNACGFDQSPREQASSLWADVQQAAGLNSLELATGSRLNGLLAFMNEHQRERVEHEQEVSDHPQALMERVNSMGQDTKALRSYLEDQRQKALADPLTGLLSRTVFSERLEQEVARRYRDDGNLLLAMLGIDHFKRVNDDFGHLTRDRVLKITTGELYKRLRQVDFVVRFGGGEFVILFPAIPLEAGRQLLERLRTAITACPFHSKGGPLSITCSVGTTAFEGNEASKVVFGRTGQTLYRAKCAGRDHLEATWRVTGAHSGNSGQVRPQVLPRLARMVPPGRMTGCPALKTPMDMFGVVALIFLATDPFDNIAVLPAALEGVAPGCRLCVAFHGLAFIPGLLLLLLTLGEHILSGLGLSREAVGITGGIALFVAVMRLIFPLPQGPLDEVPGGELLLVPPATLAVAGPPALAMSTTLHTTFDGSLRELYLAAMPAWAVTALILLQAAFLQRSLDPRGLTVIERLTGMLLIMLSVDMLLDNLRSVLHIAT